MNIDIKDYEGLYTINREGEINSIRCKNRIMKQGVMTSGYPCIVLNKNKIAKTLSIHRLLAIHFIPNPNNYEQVNHINGIKTDNRLENLEWCTRSQNIQHAYDSGLKKYKPLHYKGKFGKNHNRSKSILCVTNGVTYGSMSEASRELKVPISTISASISEKRATQNFEFKII